MKISLITAFDDNQLIGKDNGLPWYIPEDLKWFKEVTIGSIVVMGRKTWEAHPKPLPERTNIVISKTIDESTLPEEVIVMESLLDAFLFGMVHGSDVYVIGGKAMYAEALEYVEKVYISHIKGEHEGDTYFPSINLRSEWMRISRKRFTTHDSCIYIRKGTGGGGKLSLPSQK